MKKIFAIIIIAFSSSCFAQEILPVTFGPFVSISSTSLNSKPDFKDQVAGAGYNIGAFVRLKLLFLYGQCEASYGTKSASVTAANNGTNENFTFKLSGLDVSAIVGLKLFGLGDLGNFRVFTGYNWNNYSDITYSVDGNNFSSGNVNSNNHSLLGGIGIDLSKFAFDLKYINGLNDLTDSGTTDVKSTVFSLSIAYKIW